jgi:uncharacterized protein (DUF305 family)
MIRWMIPVAAIALLAGCGRRAEEPASQDTATMADTSAMHGSRGNGMASGNAGTMGHGAADDTASINRMMADALGPADSSYDARFVDMMIPHHQSAIDMANIALTAAVHPEIKAVARNIARDQKNEIDRMRAWRLRWYGQGGGKDTSQFVDVMRRMDDAMLTGLGARDSTFDLRFINMMIPHHQAAIAMAWDALAKSRRPEILDLARAVIAAQQKEINAMKQWRQQWYGQ